MSYYEYDNVYGWGYLFYCDEIDNLYTLDILFGDVWLEMLVDDYVANFDGFTCAFCITDSGDPEFAILGDALMRNYYSIHDGEYS